MHIKCVTKNMLPTFLYEVPGKTNISFKNLKTIFGNMYNFNLPNWYEVVIHSFETHFSLLSQISSHAFFETPWIWIFI